MSGLNKTLIPNFPTGLLLNSDKSDMSDEWKLYLQQLTQAIQQTVSSQGLRVPPNTAAQISQLTAPSASFSIMGDSDNNVLKVNLNGTIKTIATL
jgi:hypothetical protein